MQKNKIRVFFGPDSSMKKCRPFHAWLENILIYTRKYPNYFIKFF